MRTAKAANKLLMPSVPVACVVIVPCWKCNSDQSPILLHHGNHLWDVTGSIEVIIIEIGHKLAGSGMQSHVPLKANLGCKTKGFNGMICFNILCRVLADQSHRLAWRALQSSSAVMVFSSPRLHQNHVLLSLFCCFELLRRSPTNHGTYLRQAKIPFGVHVLHFWALLRFLQSVMGL